MNITDGRILADNFCGSDEDCSSLLGAAYICTKGLSNPINGVTSFNNIADSAIMVWQIITMEGWTYVMNKMTETTGPITNIYFVLVVLAGSFFLINLILAVITIYFSLE